MSFVVVLVINQRFSGQLFDYQSFDACFWCRSIAFPHIGMIPSADVDEPKLVMRERIRQPFGCVNNYLAEQ